MQRLSISFFSMSLSFLFTLKILLTIGVIDAPSLSSLIVILYLIFHFGWISASDLLTSYMSFIFLDLRCWRRVFFLSFLRLLFLITAVDISVSGEYLMNREKQSQTFDERCIYFHGFHALKLPKTKYKFS